MKRKEKLSRFTRVALVLLILAAAPFIFAGATYGKTINSLTGEGAATAFTARSSAHQKRHSICAGG